MVSMGQNDRSAIKAILAGDKEAYAGLVVRHSRRLFLLACRITGNVADADDVVQEAFLRGYMKLKAFEQRSDFGTWIYRIAVHCALDRLTERKSDDAGRVAGETDDEQEWIQVADAAPGPERLVLSAEIGALQEMAMRGLTPIERTAFVLRHIEERTTEEIAAMLKIKPNTAKQTVFRAVQKVRQRLATLKVTA